MFCIVDLEGQTILELTSKVVLVEIPEADLDYDECVLNRARMFGRSIIMSNKPTQMGGCPHCSASLKKKRKAAEKVLSHIVAQEISGVSYRCVTPVSTDLVLAHRLMKKLKKMVNDEQQ